MINNNQRKKENTALSEGSLEPRSSLDNATIDREKGTKDVDNHADVNNKMKDKPLSEKDKMIEVLHKQIIHLEDFYAERVKKLKEEIDYFKEMYMEENDFEVFKKKVDKIMGNFNSPQKNRVKSERDLSVIERSSSKDTNIKKDKGCGEWYSAKDKDGLYSPKKCGVIGLCPKCEVGLKEDKQ